MAGGYIHNVKKNIPKERRLPPEFKGKVELNPDNEWIAKTPPERKTYPQHWHSYNQYQTQEKLMFYKILNDSVDSLEIEEKFGQVGRPFHLLRDMIKCCCIKVFSGFSSRRTISELKLVQKLGYIKEVPHYNTIINYFDSEEMQVYLETLYRILSLPLKGIENKFAVDSTGFSSSVKVDWLNVRLEGKPVHRDWKKLHVITGVQTNIISAVKITGAYSSDTLHFQELVGATAENFAINEVSADAGYIARNNVDFVTKMGGKPFILPRTGMRLRSMGSQGWKQMMWMWRKNQKEFKKHYHLRSNVESTFSMMKRKFSDNLRSKKDQSQINEILCKVICHNISVLVNGIFDLDIQLNWS